MNFLALRSLALFLSNGESSRHPFQGSCMLKNSNNMATTINATRATRRTLTIRQWLNKKNKANICNVQNFFLSLPCQKITSGTDTAESPRHFLYPHFSENNITAPCRVFGNDPGSSACKTLTTRSAVSLCQNLQVMATTINATRAAQRAFSLKEWMNGKSNFYSQIAEFPVTRLLAIRINLLSLCVFVAAVAIEQQPVFSLISTLCAGYLVYRINKSEKEGGAL